MCPDCKWGSDAIKIGLLLSIGNMRKLTWNEDLATVAQKWADQCLFDHDKNRHSIIIWIIIKLKHNFWHIGVCIFKYQISTNLVVSSYEFSPVAFVYLFLKKEKSRFVLNLHSESFLDLNKCQIFQQWCHLEFL